MPKHKSLLQHSASFAPGLLVNSHLWILLQFNGSFPFEPSLLVTFLASNIVFLPPLQDLSHHSHCLMDMEGLMDSAVSAIHLTLPWLTSSIVFEEDQIPNLLYLK